MLGFPQWSYWPAAHQPLFSQLYIQKILYNILFSTSIFTQTTFTVFSICRMLYK